MKVLVALALFLLLSACSIPRSVKEGGPVVGQNVKAGGSVLILSVPDGQEQGQPAATGSGQGLVTAIRKALSAHAVPLSISQSSSLATGFDESQSTNMDYVLKSAITLWQDNATAWSGNGDKLSISIELYDSRTKRLVAASSHQRVATGSTFVAGSPDRFMDEVAQGALVQIYGWPTSR